MNNGGTGMAAPVEGPNGQMVKALDLSQLTKRKATAEEKEMLEAARRPSGQEKKEFQAQVIKKNMDDKIQTIFRKEGEWQGYVTKKGAVALRSEMTEFDPIVKEIKNDNGMSREQVADRLSEKLGDAFRNKFGEKGKIQQFPEGDEMTMGEFWAQRNGHDSVEEYLLANRGQLVMDTNVFADVFSEE